MTAMSKRRLILGLFTLAVIVGVLLVCVLPGGVFNPKIVHLPKPADEPLSGPEWVIRLRQPQVGDRHQVEETSTVRVEEETQLGFGKQAKRQTQRATTTETLCYTEVVLEKADGVKKPTRLRRIYTKAESTA